MKVAIYCRVSDDKKQRDGEFKQDVQRQVQLLGNPLKEKGIEFQAYIDEGKSAFTEDINGRPAFKQLLNDCRRNFIKTIYIEDLTRFSRNLSIGLRWLKELGELGVDVVSIKDGEIEVTSAKGWMQSAIMLMFAEWDSRIKSEKVKSGMAKAKREGKVVGGRRLTHLAPLDSTKTIALAREFPK